MKGGPVLFLFKSGRKSRRDESGPREFFYGFTEMQRSRIEAEMLEEDELPPAPLTGLAERLATRLLDPLAGLNADTLSRLSTQVALERMNKAGALVATTNAHGLALGALKSLGRLKPPVLFLPMGVWPIGAGILRRHMLARWLAPLDLAPISKTEEAWLASRLAGRQRNAYLPFGIDTAFWTPTQEAVLQDPGGGFAFAIGNDPHRDWSGLAKAWTPALPKLKIVTRRPVPVSAGRIEILAGDWNSRPISDIQVRSFYREALFVVLPLNDTIQPSGQSACLQAMSCGKAVILSDIRGLWDSELLRHGETCLLTPPGDHEALAAAANRLAHDPVLAERLGRAARSIVAQRFTIERMGDVMAGRLHGLLSASGFQG
jgi:glycosyltransferase involved in cell wall biosynthesis